MTRIANLWRLPKASAGFIIFEDQSSISSFFFGNAVSWASPTAFVFPRLLEPRARHFGAVDEQPRRLLAQLSFPSSLPTKI